MIILNISDDLTSSSLPNPSRQTRILQKRLVCFNLRNSTSSNTKDPEYVRLNVDEMMPVVSTTFVFWAYILNMSKCLGNNLSFILLSSIFFF